MFDFVSPFDVFEPARSRPASGINTQSQTPVSARSSSGSGIQRTVTSPPGPVPLSLQRHISPPGPTPPQLRGPIPTQVPRKTSQVSATGAQDTPPSAIPQGSHLTNVRSNSPAGPAGKALADAGRKTSSPMVPSKSRQEDLTLPWLSSKLVKGEEGEGPKALMADGINIDLSKPSLDSLVNAPGTVQVTPTTIMKAERAGFNNRRAVGQTPGWLAYTVTRGRIRIIDRKSGARKLIQLRDTGSIIDIAVHPTGLAAVASDGSVSVFRVPARFERNDPDCPLLFYLPSISENEVPAEKSLGSVNQVEWVRRDSATEHNWLAIGGTAGAVIIKPSEWSDDDGEANPRSVLSASTVLKTNGVIVQFCLNATHQALGLLSSSGYFVLYSVVNLNRVWHRQLPTAAPQLPVSSVSFAEANILVGRGMNAHFDLVQITVELAVLTTISFNAPPPNSSAYNFASVQYDSDRQTLFIAPFARGSMYAFHYALKTRPPIRGVSESAVAPFDSMAEFPLEPVLTFVVGGTDDVEFLFSTPNGINQATIERPSLAPASAPAAQTAQPAKNEKKGKKQQQKEQREQQQQQQREQKEQQQREQRQQSTSPEPESAAPSVVSQPIQQSTRATNGPANEVASGSAGGLSSDDLTRALKKSEDKLANMFRQAIQKEMGQFASRLEQNQDIATSVQNAVNAHFKQLPSIVQNEIKRALPQAVQGEVRAAVGEHAPAAIHQSLQNVGQHIERAIAPIIPRSVAAAVQPAVDRAVSEAIGQSLIPALDNATTHVYEQLAADLKTELVQIRKDLASEQSEALTATNTMIRDMGAVIADLQKQVAGLMTQVRSNQAQPMASAPSVGSSIKSPPSDPLGPAPTHIASHVPPQNAQQLEDAFLNALHQQTVPATINLVRERAPQTDALFPAPPAKSPLSQAVLLTLCHRLAVALGEINPHDPIFQTVATWERLVVALIDPRDPAIQSYFKRVVGVVGPTLGNVITRLQQAGQDPLIQAHIGVIRSAAELLERKAQQ